MVSNKPNKFTINNKYFESMSFTEFQKLQNLEFDYFFNYAFLTGNNIKDMDSKTYVKSTDKIIFEVESFFANNQIKKALLASSGAVYWKNTIKENIYCLQKIKQEEIFIQSALTNNIDYKIARIFGLLANPDFSRYEYAFTSFVNQARSNRRIVVKSDIKVERSYLFFHFLLDFFLLDNIDKRFDIFDAWNFNSDISDLATLVAEHFDAKVEFSSDYSSRKVDRYISKDYEFQELYKKNFDLDTELKKLLIP